MKSLFRVAAILLFFCALSVRAQNVFNTAYTDSVATNPTLQFNSNTAPADAIVIWGYSNPNVSDFTGVPTDTDVNKFSQTITEKNTANTLRGTVWTETGLTGDSRDTVTCHSIAALGGTLQCYAVEMHGVNTLDQYACATGTGTAVASPSVTTTHPNELLLGFGNSTSLDFLDTPGAGWKDVALSSQGIEMQQVSATGKFKATFTSGNSAPWVACIATYYNSNPGFITQRDSGWWNGCGSAGNSVPSVICPTAPTHSGDTLLAWAAYSNGSTATLSDSANQTWTKRQSIDFEGAGGNLSIWTLDNTVAGVTDIKVSLSANGPIDSGFIELNGMQNPAYDSGCTGQVSGSKTTTATCSYTSTQNDWLFALGGASTTGPKVGKGYTLLNDESTTAYYLSDPDEYAQNVAAGTQSPSFSWTGGGVWGGITAIALKQACVPDKQGNLLVSEGQTCMLDHSILDGSVRQTGGSIVITNSTITGNFESTGEGTFSISASKIDGRLHVENVRSGLDPSQVCGTIVDGNLGVHYDDSPILIGSQGPPVCAGNTVAGDLNVNNNTSSLQIVGNKVDGSMRVRDNSGPTEVFNNTIDGALHCKDNTHLSIASPNTASDYDGNCF